MFKSILFMCPILILTTACGKHIQESKSLVVQEGSISEGAFHARMKTINQNVSGNSTGMAKMDIAGDNIVIDVDMAATPVGVSHQQFIRAGKRCPTASDDLNKDGFIDAQEEYKVVGEIIVSLDDDLHEADKGNYPLTNDAAAYYYSETGSLVMMQPNLKGNLKLDGRIVTVHGINKETILPKSVASRDGQTSTVTLPISCGKIFPGNIDE